MRLLITFAILALSVCEVHAQATPPCTAPCTKSQLLNDVQTQFPDNTVGAITPSILRTFQNNFISSSMATSPVTAGAFTCYAGTTGLLGACTAALGISLGGTGATTQPGAATAVFPAPVRPGDLVYWNGSLWVTLPGNNSGTLALTENSAGVPSWAAFNVGTVTSVTAGTGLSGGTITTSGTIALNISSLSYVVPADIAVSTSYVDGPVVAQGTVGTWYAGGSVTLSDTAASAAFLCKLWDGTTIIASTGVILVTAAAAQSIFLSGIIANPTGNIRISCKDSNTTGTIRANISGNGKDSTINTLRLQ